MKSIKNENVIVKIFSIFVFHIRMSPIYCIINPINFMKVRTIFEFKANFCVHSISQYLLVNFNYLLRNFFISVSLFELRLVQYISYLRHPNLSDFSRVFLHSTFSRYGSITSVQHSVPFRYFSRLLYHFVRSIYKEFF